MAVLAVRTEKNPVSRQAALGAIWQPWRNSAVATNAARISVEVDFEQLGGNVDSEFGRPDKLEEGAQQIAREHRIRGTVTRSPAFGHALVVFGLLTRQTHMSSEAPKHGINVNLRETPSSADPSLHRIVIVGGGAAGLELATRLGSKLGRRGKVSITLLDKSRLHIWKPLLHEIASGSLDSETDSLRPHRARSLEPLSLPNRRDAGTDPREAADPCGAKLR